MSELDDLFAAVKLDRMAFTTWVGRVERPIRASLAPFARAVDVEGIVQETLLRMWHVASGRTVTLTGENASLRYAFGMARNLARNEARRLGRLRYLPPEELPEPEVPPDPAPDPALLRFLRECLAVLGGKPREALLARLELGSTRPDRLVAAELGMQLNTFLQNIVRARRQVRDCLLRKGVPAGEIES